MSYKRVETLGDAIRFGLDLEIICGNAACGRRRIVAPAALLHRFSAGRTFAHIGARLRCRGTDLEGGGCGCRGAIVRYLPNTPPPPPPPDPGSNVVAFTARSLKESRPAAASQPRRKVARARKRSHL